MTTMTMAAHDESPTDEHPRAEAARASGLPAVTTWQLLGRVLRVAAVLFYCVALRALDLVGVRWLVCKARGLEYERIDGPVAARRAFEMLGPTYVKLGQLVASGEALFPARYSDEFRKLLDRVPPFSLEAVEATLAEELGEARSRIAHVEPEPMAAASIAQVHAALLDDGREVVLKVQRPGIAQLAAADVVLMRAMARFGASLSETIKYAGTEEVIEDFAENLVAELDFRNESERMQQFNEVMEAMGTESVAAPRVELDLSTPRVLTMERFDGWSLGDTEAVNASPYDAEERLITGIRAWFQTLIMKGFFHGDVHAGNFMLLKDGRIGYLDFGIVGVFDDAQKASVLEYVLGFQEKDFARVGRAMLSMGTVRDPEGIEMERFIADLTVAYAPLANPGDGAGMKDLVPNMMELGQQHGLRMPRELILVTKQLVYLDRYSRAYGGDDMNVLTDQRLNNLIMQDMLAAMFAG